MAQPTLIYDEAVMQTLLGLRRPERLQVMQELQRLKTHHEDADPIYSLRDASDRVLSVIAARPFLITYWLDGPVNELRIVDVQRVRF